MHERASICRPGPRECCLAEGGQTPLSMIITESEEGVLGLGDGKEMNTEWTPTLLHMH